MCGFLRLAPGTQLTDRTCSVQFNLNLPYTTRMVLQQVQVVVNNGRPSKEAGTRRLTGRSSVSPALSFPGTRLHSPSSVPAQSHLSPSSVPSTRASRSQLSLDEAQRSWHPSSPVSPHISPTLNTPGTRLSSRHSVVKMEALYKSNLNRNQTLLDDIAFDLVNLDLPKWYINADIKVAFRTRAMWDSVVSSSSPLTPAPGLEEVLSGSSPPSIDYFKTLPQPSKSQKQWAVYALVLEKLDCKPKLYVGSGTNALDSVKARFASYTNLTSLPELIDNALKEGYSITSRGMLCWVDLPPPHLVPRLRARMLALEAVLTIVFYACRKTIMDDLFIPDFFIWQRQDVSWDPACTHLSLSKGVRGDLQLSDEELTLAAAARLTQRRTAGVIYRRKYRQRKRDEDEEAYLLQELRQHQKWSANNPGRRNEIAAGVRQRAKDTERFRCDLCEINFFCQYDKDQHLKSNQHAEAVKNGGKVVKELSYAALAKRASRAAAKARSDHFCEACQKPFDSIDALKRHQKTKVHQKKFLEQQNETS